MNKIKKYIKRAHSCINTLNSQRDTGCHTCDLCVMMQTSTKRNFLQLKKIITYVCSNPVRLYFRPSIVSYFAAAEHSDQQFRQTALKPGCIVTRRRVVSTSRETRSFDRYSTNFSISWQQLQALPSILQALQQAVTTSTPV